MYPARRWARRAASAVLEVTMQSTFQEKCTFTVFVGRNVGLPAQFLVEPEKRSSCCLDRRVHLVL